MSPLLRRLIERAQLPLVDEVSLEAFLDGVSQERAQALLFLSGDGANRPETGDVAVVLPELLSHFSDRLRGAVIAPEAEEDCVRGFTPMCRQVSSSCEDASRSASCRKSGTGPITSRRSRVFSTLARLCSPDRKGRRSRFLSEREPDP